MKKKDISTYRQMEKSELAKKLMEVEVKLVDLAINRYTKPSKNRRECFWLRKQSAVIQSIMKEKQEG